MKIGKRKSYESLLVFITALYESSDLWAHSSSLYAYGYRDQQLWFRTMGHLRSLILTKPTYYEAELFLKCTVYFIFKLHQKLVIKHKSYTSRNFLIEFGNMNKKKQSFRVSAWKDTVQQWEEAGRKVQNCRQQWRNRLR